MSSCAKSQDHVSLVLIDSATARGMTGFRDLRSRLRLRAIRSNVKRLVTSAYAADAHSHNVNLILAGTETGHYSACAIQHRMARLPDAYILDFANWAGCSFLCDVILYYCYDISNTDWAMSIGDSCCRGKLI